jgi:hypothetical protein
MISKFLLNDNGQPLDNQNTQDLIKKKIDSGGITLENGTVLTSEAGVKGEIAKLLKAQYMGKGLKPDLRRIDFLVYGIDKPEE